MGTASAAPVEAEQRSERCGADEERRHRCRRQLQVQPLLADEGKDGVGRAEEGAHELRAHKQYQRRLAGGELRPEDT